MYGSENFVTPATVFFTTRIIKSLTSLLLCFVTYRSKSNWVNAPLDVISTNKEYEAENRYAWLG